MPTAFIRKLEAFSSLFCRNKRAPGLSAVHVNRMLQRLHGEGLVTSGDGQATIDDPAGLRAARGFDPACLHPACLHPGGTGAGAPDGAGRGGW